MPKLSRSIAQLARIADKQDREIQKKRAKGLPVLPSENATGALFFGVILTIFATYLLGWSAFIAGSGITIHLVRVRGARASNSQYQSTLPIIASHARELTVRRSQLTIRQNYGLIDESRWHREADVFIGTVLRMHCGDIALNNYDRVRAAIWEATAGYESITPSFSRGMEPVAYEHMVASILRDHGWDARTTKGSGDQGVDVLARRGGVTLVVQCKLYSKPVSNAGVQEAIAGRTFERADFAAVVTNADFTKSARQLATSAGVHLLHHDQLGDLAVLCRAGRAELRA